MSVCDHGQLQRQCPLCERDAEIARLQREVVDAVDREAQSAGYHLERIKTLVRALAAEQERTKVVAVCAHCKGDIRVCQGRTENGDGVWKHLHCALLETLAAERAEDRSLRARYADALNDLAAERREVARLEGVVIPHARKQENANGFQRGWHAALDRVSGGEHPDVLVQLVPEPSAHVEIPVCTAERDLAAERAKRCGTCADAGRPWLASEGHRIICHSEHSECRIESLSWSAAHCCPHWRRKEGR